MNILYHPSQKKKKNTKLILFSALLKIEDGNPAQAPYEVTIPTTRESSKSSTIWSLRLVDSDEPN